MAVDLKYMDEMLKEMLENLPDSPTNKSMNQKPGNLSLTVEFDKKKSDLFVNRLLHHFSTLAPVYTESEKNT